MASLLPLAHAGARPTAAQALRPAAAPPERLQYHVIRTDPAGHILPWHGDDLGAAFDHTIRLVWNFWDHMPPDRNGLPYHLNHQVWRPDLDDDRGIGGDQIQMALSSWSLLWGYLGNQSMDDQPLGGQLPRWGRIVENMRMMADHVLAHGLSAPTDRWANLPYPYNTSIYSGRYDGDMILGPGYTQPDKAGSLGIELVTLFKITGEVQYLQAAVNIANTLAARMLPGDARRSPLPFKVHARTGAIGKLLHHDGKVQQLSDYTTNWAGTLRLFDALLELARQQTRGTPPHDRHGRPVEGFDARGAKAWQRGWDLLLAWMLKHPLQNNRWGPFFEDIEGWSDTQINAVTFAEFLMDHRDRFPDWAAQVRGILDWADRTLGNDTWAKYGVRVMNEQTAYQVPGNSHSARQAAAELRFAELTGDRSRTTNAIRQLVWASYHVDHDGKNRYFRDDVWMTDGYGDFVRHYLRAMAAAPDLAPADQHHLLRWSSALTQVRYLPTHITYTTYDRDAEELLRLATRPARIVERRGDEERVLPEVAAFGDATGWTWRPLGERGGVVEVRHAHRTVTVQLR